MLFLATRVLEHEFSDTERLRLLERLADRGFVPLIRSTRLSCYEQVLADADQVLEMEHLIATLTSLDEQTPYVPGELFCFEDHTFFLLFGELEDGTRGIRAGVIYEQRTSEPLLKLNLFCQTLSQCMGDAGGERSSLERLEGGTQRLGLWRQEQSAIHEGFRRFVTKQDADSLSIIACRENARDRVRAARFLDDDRTRHFLRRAREALAEGYPVKSLTSEKESAPSEFTINQLLEAGLLRREVLLSCRQSGHTLFTLPSADALAAITISNAMCSECGASVADERIEEALAPTNLSAVLLEDGAWMVNRLHAILREFGISESEIAIEPPAGDGEARMMVRVCGESFLIVMRDGDLTPAFARRAINTKIESDAQHLVVAVAGKIHNEGRALLLSFSKRLTRSGDDFEMIIAQGISAATMELERAFERVSQKVLAEQLCELDASIGVSAAGLVRARFQILRNSGQLAPPKQLAADTESERQAQNVSHAISLIDFDLLEIN